MEPSDSNVKMLGIFLAGMLVAGGSAFFLTGRSEPAASVPAASVKVAAQQPMAADVPVEKPAAGHVEEVVPPVTAMKPAETKPAQRSATAHPQHVIPPKLVARAEAPKAVSPMVDPTPVKKDTTSMPPVNAEPHSVLAPAVPAPVAVVEQPKPVVPKPREPQSVTLPAGTLIPVRLSDAISTEKQLTNDPFTAVLSEPLVINGMVIAERGSRAEGRIVSITRAGKVKGTAHVAIELTQFISSDGQKVRIQTALFEKEGQSSGKKDAGKVAAAAGIGAAVGAIFGCGKGAAIGAGAGGGAAGGGVLLTRGEPVVLPVETRISFRVTDPVTLTEKLR